MLARERAVRNIKLTNIAKALGGQQILQNLSLQIPSGKFFALLGPSGCGKTTILRLIAGLEQVDAGSITLGEQDITHVPINERSVNTVFQQYALFPHLNVFENVAYSLRLRNTPFSQVQEKVQSTLRILHLDKHGQKHINNLSGGQQQRVALARAIINEPDVLLLDEPLAALDLNLREQVLIELINLQDKLKTTFIYVTHDQDEALTVADQMAIMNQDGKIEQIGTPREIYEFPTSRFVATFVGKTNLMQGTLQVNEDGMSFEVPGLGKLSVFVPKPKDWMLQGVQAYLSLRPEKIAIAKQPDPQAENQLSGTVENIVYYGSETRYQVKLADGRLLNVFAQNSQHIVREPIDYDDNVYLSFAKENVVLLER